MAVLALVQQPEEVSSVLRWGCRCAAGDDAGLVVLHPRLAPERRVVDLTSTQPGGTEDPVSDRLLAEAAAIGREAAEAALADGHPAPLIRLVSAQGPDLVELVLALLSEHGATLLLVPRGERLRGGGAEQALSRQLFRRAPCTTGLLRTLGPPSRPLGSILVPTAGGPHAQVALRWGCRLAREHDARITALLVEATAGEDPAAVGARLLETALQEADAENEPLVDRRVVVADDVLPVIRDAAGSADLVLVGATRQGFVRRVLFGVLPDQLAPGEAGSRAVIVLRAPRSFASRLLEGIDRHLSGRLPQLTRPERVALFESLQTRSRWDADFMSLMALSTAIAGFGLVQSSTAVVIGAMLVAPLMTPLLSAGLALVQGNLPLLRTALRALGLGFSTALVIGFGVGLLDPLPALTPELAARGAPTLLDLAVALLSGVAAAYATARPGLSAALPGVAIAAALVPPIATTGISLALGETSNAGGAALLFATNAVAIVLGTAVTLHLLGIRGGGPEAPRLWVRRTLLGLVLTLFLLAFPLTSYLAATLAQATGTTHRSSRLRTAIEEVLSKEAGTKLLSLRLETREPLVIETRLAVRGPLDDELADALAAAAAGTLDQPVELRISLVVIADGVP